MEVILRKDLPISTVCRLAIEYDETESDPDRPRSLFLKLPRVLGEDTARVPGVDDHAEIEFYRDLAPGMSCPPLIRCYDAAHSDETNRSHILLDDLSETHTQPEQSEAPSKEMSRLAVEALGRAHAHWWNPPSPRPRAEFDVSGFIENLRKTVSEFSASAELTVIEKDAYSRMLGAADRIWGRMTRQDNLTVTHGDMHWWNFLYPKDPFVHSVHLFDWHLWHVDLGARDLAFLLALGGFAEPRPEIEDDLLHAYHETLIENGVADYSWEMLIEDYRWSAIRNLNIPVIFRSQGKHESTWRTALRRAVESYERLDCGSLL